MRLGCQKDEQKGVVCLRGTRREELCVFSLSPERLWLGGHGSLRCTDRGGGGERGRSGGECLSVGLTLINVALVVGVRLAVGPLLYVGHVFVKVRQRHSVLLIYLPLHVRLQHWPLIVGKRHREQGFGVAHKLVDVSLSGHLEVERGERCVVTLGCWLHNDHFPTNAQYDERPFYLLDFQFHKHSVLWGRVFRTSWWSSEAPPSKTEANQLCYILTVSRG